MNQIRVLFVFLLLVTAPFVGVWLALANQNERLDYVGQPVETLENIDVQVTHIRALKDDVLSKSEHIETVVSKYIETFSGQSLALAAEIERSENQASLSDDIYERRITSVLGDPVSSHKSPQVEIKLFKLEELDYRGYMAKVKLFDPQAFEVVLAEDKIGGFETTSSMAMRNRAMLAINGGGFGSSPGQNGLISGMIGATVSGGEIVQSFIKKDEPLFFAGIDHEGRVIGTVPETQADVDALKPKDGVSFIPVLLKDGEKVKLPPEWVATRHPRTILGRYANDDLLLIVVDGRQAFWSKGVTLERLQDKLLDLGVQDAYNLDGGGSSTIYYNGSVLNRPSDGTERPVANAIIIKP